MTLAEHELAAEIGDAAIEFASKDACLRLAPGDVFLDVGSSRGSWSARALAQGADVFMIDSSATPNELIELCIKLGINDKIKLCLFHAGDGTNGSTKIDSIDIPRIDFIKIDIEGCEVLAIRGASETIKSQRPMIMTEVHHCYGVELESVARAIDACAEGYVHTTIGEQKGWYTHLFSRPHEKDLRLPQAQ